MNPSPARPLLLFSLSLTGLWACHAVSAFTTTSTATPPPLSTVSSTPAPTEWLPLNPGMVNSEDCEQLVDTAMTVADAETLTQQEIVQALFALYLKKHLALPLHHFCRLEEYRIERVSADSRIDFLAKEQGVDFVSRIVYSVQIHEIPSGWAAGNGELAAEGWIINKGLIVGVVRVGREYVLRLIGTGP